jgi:hypothetical protein
MELLWGKLVNRPRIPAIHQLQVPCNSSSPFYHYVIPAGNLPGVTDLQMTHHSDVCVLLRWTSPGSPLHSSPTHIEKLGYRVFVNGTAEGMVRMLVSCVKHFMVLFPDLGPLQPEECCPVWPF